MTITLIVAAVVIVAALGVFAWRARAAQPPQTATSVRSAPLPPASDDAVDGFATNASASPAADRIFAEPLLRGIAHADDAESAATDATAMSADRPPEQPMVVAQQTTMTTNPDAAPPPPTPMTPAPTAGDPDATPAPPAPAPEAVPGPGPGPQAPRRPRPANAGGGGPMAERFAAANTTHDGRLTLPQAQAAGMHMIVRQFQAIDANHQGYVTLQDIRTWMRARRAERQGEQGATGVAPVIKGSGQ